MKEETRKTAIWQPEDKVQIDPMIDCVFKAILGRNENKKVLINFLNSILEVKDNTAIIDVEILNPYNEREFTSDKLSIVDIRVKDSSQSVYDIEVQAYPHPCLASRMLYGWSSFYHYRISKGDDYSKLMQTTSIWLLNDSLFKETQACHLCFSAYDPVHELYLSDHFKIHVIQLDKFKALSNVSTDKDRWLKFFKEGKNMNPYNIPEDMKTPELENAFYTMRSFLENEQDYFLYQKRLDSERERATWHTLINQERQARINAEKREQQAKLDAEKGVNQERQARIDAEKREQQAKLDAEKGVNQERQARINAEKREQQAKLDAEKGVNQERQARINAEKKNEYLRALLKKAGVSPEQEQD